jgi:hypothetical protein
MTGKRRLVEVKQSPVLAKAFGATQLVLALSPLLA